LHNYKYLSNNISFNLSNIRITNSDQNLIRRKSICTCDSGCPKCKSTTTESIQSIRPKLKISQPYDPFDKRSNTTVEEEIVKSFTHFQNSNIINNQTNDRTENEKIQ
jgi:hypothetical protein